MQNPSLPFEVKMKRVFIITFVVLIASSCEKSPLRPVEVTAEKGKNEVRAVIGAEGGVIRFSDGAQLSIPEKVLQEEITFVFRRAEPKLDLPGKDVLDQAYSIAPRVSFLPGSVRLSIPISRTLPGSLDEINLTLYCYGRKVSASPQGELSQETWYPCPQAKLTGRSQDGKFLQFELSESTATRDDKFPFGFLQAAFDVPKNE
jgi:hypothetical protein